MTKHYSEDQALALKTLKLGKNAFLTGLAGAGKTTVVKDFIAWAEQNNKQVAVAAPTGIAASRIGGATLHSLFRLSWGFSETHPDDNYQNSIIQETDILIIDEISMVRIDVFEYIYLVIKNSNPNMQVVLVGDFNQLPPIITDSIKEVMTWFYPKETPLGGYAFLSQYWEKLSLCPLVLVTNHRQENDKEYIKHINLIREGNFSGITFFNNLPIPPKHNEKAIHIVVTNKHAKAINERKLAPLNPKITYIAEIIGKVSPNDYPTDVEITLAENARVMMTANIANCCRNGELGTITKIEEQRADILLDSGQNVTVYPYRWEIFEYRIYNGKLAKKLVGEFIQIPMKPGYAVTVHKSQGQSFDYVILSLNRCFANGQLYVGLSRGRMLSGLTLTERISAESLRSSVAVKEFNQKIFSENYCPIEKYQPQRYQELKLHTKRFVSPPIADFHKLRPALTKGEMIVFEFFHKHLSSDWEIYLQPYLNGLRPDIVLLNPKVGIAVFEIKDWKLDTGNYQIEQSISDTSPRLTLTRANGRKVVITKNPVSQIKRYKDEIYNLYCPRLKTQSGFSVITAGLIFPFASKKRVEELFLPLWESANMIRYYHTNPLVALEDLQSDCLNKVFAAGNRKQSRWMNETVAQDLRSWLIEPDFSSAQREPLELDKVQLQYATTRTESGYRRIRGAAGSGKSLVLAARAAQIASEGKKVLVVTYNITLCHYLRGLAARYQFQNISNAKDSIKNITWVNFHYWCKTVFYDAGCAEIYHQLWVRNKTDDDNAKNKLNEELPYLTGKILEEDTDNFVPRYDAILVDEGQDFQPLWWNILRKACQPNGEMLLVSDSTQDIYGTSQAWTDNAMKEAGFLGKWAELPTCYRMPQKALEKAAEFAKKYLPNSNAIVPQAQQELMLNPCLLKWVHTNPQNAVQICVNEVFEMAMLSNPDSHPNDDILAMADIVFLSAEHYFGMKVVDKFNDTNINVTHTFANNSQETRRQKLGFYMGCADIKATTLHSFKGWESRSLVIYIGEKDDDKSLALIYAGLTRIKRHTKCSYLTVVSSSEKLKEFGKTWEVYQEIDC